MASFSLCQKNAVQHHYILMWGSRHWPLTHGPPRAAPEARDDARRDPEIQQGGRRWAPLPSRPAQQPQPRPLSQVRLKCNALFPNMELLPVCWFVDPGVCPWPQGLQLPRVRKGLGVCISVLRLPQTIAPTGGLTPQKCILAQSWGPADQVPRAPAQRLGSGPPTSLVSSGRGHLGLRAGVWASTAPFLQLRPYVRLSSALFSQGHQSLGEGLLCSYSTTSSLRPQRLYFQMTVHPEVSEGRKSGDTVQPPVGPCSAHREATASLASGVYVRPGHPSVDPSLRASPCGSQAGLSAVSAAHLGARGGRSGPRCTHFTPAAQGEQRLCSWLSGWGAGNAVDAPPASPGPHCPEHPAETVPGSHLQLLCHQGPPSHCAEWPKSRPAGSP